MSSSRVALGPEGEAGQVPPVMHGTRSDETVLLAPLRIEMLAALLRTRGVRVEQVGMGPARAEAARVRLARTLPPGAPVGLVGFAGGLSASDRPGDVVVGTHVATFDESSVHELDGGLAEAVRAALARAGIPRVRAGRIVSVRRLVPARRSATMPEAAGALACDMETAWLAPLASGRPFAVVRVVVDRPGRGLFGPWVVSAGVAAWRRLAAVAPVLVRELAAVPSSGTD